MGTYTRYITARAAGTGEMIVYIERGKRHVDILKVVIALKIFLITTKIQPNEMGRERTVCLSGLCSLDGLGEGPMDAFMASRKRTVLSLD